MLAQVCSNGSWRKQIYIICSSFLAASNSRKRQLREESLVPAKKIKIIENTILRKLFFIKLLCIYIYFN
jgi:hypothetical protein